MNALVPCPMCGSPHGYVLTEGSTYRWWKVDCVHCNRTLDECASDRRTQLGTELPGSWPDADRAWNEAGAYAARPAWQGLTESEIGQFIHAHCQPATTYRSLMDFATVLNECLMAKNT